MEWTKKTLTSNGALGAQGAHTHTLDSLTHNIHHVSGEASTYEIVSNEEIRMRTDNPSVKNAWEQYQIILKLAHK